MCVASLERHWSETPFLFQGFPLSNPTELEELIKLCRHVNITVPDEEIEIRGIPTRPGRWLKPVTLRSVWSSPGIPACACACDPAWYYSSTLAGSLRILPAGQPGRR